MTAAVFHDDAHREFRAAIAHYEQQKAGLGSRFRAAVEAAVRRVCANPELYGEDETGARSAPVKRFPYTVFYLIQDDIVWIVAVAHHGRKPGYWSRRTTP